MGRDRSGRLAVAAMAGAAVIAMVAGCDSGSSDQSGPAASSTATATDNAKHGPFFPQCGGVSDQTVASLTEVTGLVNTAQNSVGCQWLQGGGISGPHFSFSWYRGSPIGRERKTEELSRTSVEDITIDGHSGFIAVGAELSLGASLCEVGIQFGDDFFEWSISFARKPFPEPCGVAKELARQSIANSK